MSVTYPITIEQKKILDSYTCERLTADPENKHRIGSFFNQRMPHLTHVLQKAWQEDRRGYPVAYYVVKNPAGEIAMFFSLKCGTLFDQNSLKTLMKKKERYDTLINSLGYDAFTEEMRGELKKLYYEVQKYEFLQADMLFDTNKSTIRVAESYPSVELVHWCLNDYVREEWQNSGMGSRGMGETLFWRFIVPTVQEIANLVGCQYLYTFVPDDSPNGAFRLYFENKLSFMSSDHLGVVKPAYDYMCSLMYQHIYPKRSGNVHGLAKHRADFFKHYNIIPGSEDIV